MRAYSYKATTFAQRFGQEHGNVELRDTLMEDANTFERVQHALEAGLVPYFTFQDHEICCRIQYNTVKAWVEDWEKGLDNARSLGISRRRRRPRSRASTSLVRSGRSSTASWRGFRPRRDTNSCNPSPRSSISPPRCEPRRRPKWRRRWR